VEDKLIHAVEKSFKKRYNFLMVFISKSPENTREIAAKLAGKIVKTVMRKKAIVIALEGELGAGKTVFVKGFAKALGVKNKITSPTFVLMRHYQVKISNFKLLVHIDAYRLADHNDLIPLGIEEIMAKPENIVLIEWAERVVKILPKDRITAHIDHIDEMKRRIEITNRPHLD
jgi:tRNA threonylcarbamoyl adenosine modification protein YjeE